MASLAAPLCSGEHVLNVRANIGSALFSGFTHRNLARIQRSGLHSGHRDAATLIATKIG